jgi:hypothetical protein
MPRVRLVRVLRYLQNYVRDAQISFLSQDESLFMLAGGKITNNNMHVYKASVKNVDLNELVNEIKIVFT